MIGPFIGRYRFLSNFYPSPFTYQGELYYFLENAFQAGKTEDPAWKKKIALASTPGKAKRLGRQAPLRDDWEETKIPLMLDLLRVKFQNKELADRLVATGNAKLVEINHWGDRFWGVCNGEGCNHLGRLLMVVRKEIRDSRG